MSERKVLNKYFPPDFDPALLTRKRKGKGEKGKPKQITVRLMAPFSMRCETCGSYIYKGKKFNARKEDAKGEKYHSIQIYRFYIRCPTCAGEITFKTDPEHLDYQAEHGAVRNFEPWREAAAEEAAAEEAVAKEEAEGGPSAMEALEARTAESRREMEILDALDGIRARNARSDRANVERILERLSGDTEGQRRIREALEDEAEAEAAFAQARKEVEEREKKGEEEEKEEVVDTVDLLRSRRKGPSSLWGRMGTEGKGGSSRGEGEEKGVMGQKKRPGAPPSLGIVTRPKVAKKEKEEDGGKEEGKGGKVASSLVQYASSSSDEE